MLALTLAFFFRVPVFCSMWPGTSFALSLFLSLFVCLVRSSLLDYFTVKVRN